MSPTHCRRCGAALSAADDGHCPACRTPPGERAAAAVHPAVARAARYAAFRTWLAELRALTPRAPVTPALIAVNVLVFVAMLAAGAKPLDPTTETLLDWGANYGPKVADGQWWRLLTAAFLHGGLAHLAFNMLCLAGVGRTTERMVGRPGFLLMYLAAAAGGSLASAGWAPGRVAVGASGAVFGTFGAFFAASARAAGTIPKPALDVQRANTGTLLLVNLAGGFFVPNVDVAAHIGGLLCGLAVGFVLGHPLRPAAVGGRRGRTLLAAALLVPVLGAGAVAVHWRVAHADDADTRLDRLSADEGRVLDAYNDAVVRAGNGALDDAGFVAVLDRDVLGPWADIRRRLESVRGASGMTPELWRQYADYLAARGEGFELLRAALATGDAAAAARSREKMAEADRLVAAIGRTR